MADDKKDIGVILVLLERFNKQRYPRAMALKKKVDGGDVLNESDHLLIKQVMEDGKKVRSLIEKHPEYKDLATKAIDLWNEIIEKDLENQKKIK
jgi:hypothetical protein